MGRMGDLVPVAPPLAGVRVVTTRSASGEDRLRALLEMAGARVLAWPTSEYPPPRDPSPLDAALARLGRFDWVVFTSARAVAAVGEGRATMAPAAGGPPTPRVAAVGPATARAATEAGWTVAVEGRGPGARGLAARVAATFPVAGARVLFPAASGAGPSLEEEFTALGARVTRVEAYRTVVTPPPAERVRADLAAGVDAVTFASPSAVVAVDRALGGAPDDAPSGGVHRALAREEARSALEASGRPPARRGGPGPVGEMTRARAREEDPAPRGPGHPAHAGELARALTGIAVACIGPTTAAALDRRGVADVRVAATATLEGVVEALVELFDGPGPGRITARHSGACP